MATKTLSFSCVSGTCTPSSSEEEVNRGDTLTFKNNTSGDVQIYSLPSAIFVNNSDFVIAAGSSHDTTIRSDAPEGTPYTYDFTCSACSGDNEPGKIIVES
jgi:hypothetical protein